MTFRTPRGSTPAAYLDHCYSELERLIVENRDRAAGFVHPAAGARGRGNARASTRLFGPGSDAPHGSTAFRSIADEVAVGFGRTGTLFACEQENVCPDLMCVAKGEQAVIRPAATLATDEIYNAFLAASGRGEDVLDGHTYTGNAVACAAGGASSRLIDENQASTTSGDAQRIEARTQRNQSSPIVGDIRHKGRWSASSWFAIGRPPSRSRPRDAWDTR